MRKRKGTFVHNHPRLKSACVSSQSDLSLHCPHEETLPPWLSKNCLVKILIGLWKWAGWSESLLGTHERPKASLSGQGLSGCAGDLNLQWVCEVRRSDLMCHLHLRILHTFITFNGTHYGGMIHFKGRQLFQNWFCLPFEKGPTLKGKNVLSSRAHSFFLE